MIRNLVAYREKSPAEAVTLAANYLGHLIQRFLDMVYFLADLQGTLSPPVFLDRLGATIVNATRTPAKRLLWMGSAFLVLFLVVNAVALFRPFRGFVDRLQNLLGWPVIVLGVICLGFWLLGSWFRKIANQSADFCERVVEAQFAAQTKNLKSRRREQDAQFLAERVIDPELLLRSSDDLMPGDLSPPRRGRREPRPARLLLREPRADLPEERPPALPGLPGRLAVPPQRHEGLGAVAGQPRPDQPAAQPPGPPAPRGPGPRPARPEPRAAGSSAAPISGSTTSPG